MPENEHYVPCYNRGCGKTFDPRANDKDECQHHPGLPVFHDAYKGWSCCNKKSVDFTEFLNIKGCTISKHSNVKPPEPEKKPLDKKIEEEVKPPIVVTAIRPPFDTELITLNTNIADSLKEQVKLNVEKTDTTEDGSIQVGTACKNNGCSTSYQGPQTNQEICSYHSGVPIFHEGLKFWSCCQKRTTDFNVFLNQPGCTTGVHKWIKEASATDTIKCRWDWHQTPDTVVVSIYAKKYDPFRSFVKLNPIRLHTKLVFPEEGDKAFELDLELRGIIKVEQCSASMLSTKVEIKLKKSEFNTWSKLDFPRVVQTKPVETSKPNVEPENDGVDLSEVEAVQNMYKVNISELEQVE